MSRILVVDDEPTVLLAFEDLLGCKGHEVVTESTAHAALERVVTMRPELVILDVMLPGMDGLEALHRLKVLCPDVPVIIMTGSETTDFAIRASMLGAFGYQPKPFEPAQMLRLIGQALAAVASAPPAPPGGPRPSAANDSMVGQSPAMQAVYQAIGRVAITDVPVLITGEPGTGKELVARAIHAHSRRHERPMLVVDCRLVPAIALECELFGCEPGAPIGAGALQVGALERASGGTLLLREVGDAPLAPPPRLIHAVRKTPFKRVGGEEPIQADVRILASTSRPLGPLLLEGRFHEDLFHQLNVTPIVVPPLRERTTDISKLAMNFVSRFALELGIAEPAIREDAWKVLLAHAWPWNVRELESCLRRALIHTSGHPIRVEDIQRALQAEPEAAARVPAGIRDRIKALTEQFLATHAGEHAHARLLDDVERELLMEALRRADGSQTRAAALLGIARPTLHAKIQKHRIHLQPALLQRQYSDESSSD